MRDKGPFVRALAAAGVAALTLASVGAVLAQQPAETATTAKSWIGRAAEFEQYLQAAEITQIDDVGRGVTNPKRAHLAPGGLCASMAWKPLRPGMYSGFWESYKAEIAAYELDKALELNMIPPTVERRVKGDLGAAIMWIDGTRTFRDVGGVPSPPPAALDKWNRQMIRAKMFHNLIGNRDPNLGNWLIDGDWNLILIDNSRALTSTKDRVHEMTRVDAGLWDRMNALTEESLTAAIGKWLGRGEIRAILERRKRMQEDIDKLVAKLGEAAVFVR